MVAAGFAHAQKKEVQGKYGYVHSELDPTKDHMDTFFLAGLHVVLDDLEVRADRAVLRSDPDDYPSTTGSGGSTGGSGYGDGPRPNSTRRIPGIPANIRRVNPRRGRRNNRTRRTPNPNSNQKVVDN